MHLFRFVIAHLIDIESRSWLPVIYCAFYLSYYRHNLSVMSVCILECLYVASTSTCGAGRYDWFIYGYLRKSLLEEPDWRFLLLFIIILAYQFYLLGWPQSTSFFPLAFILYPVTFVSYPQT